MKIMEVTALTPQGFKLAHEVMTPVEEASLIELVLSSGLSATHFSHMPGNPRSSMSYIFKYDIPSQSFVPAAPMPEGFRVIAGRAAVFAGLKPEDFTHCALNGYEPGAMIESHLDMPCWDRVVGISLGAAASLNLRRVTARGEEIVEIELPPRSMYLLRDSARHDWEHGLPPVKQPRWSITFRNFSAEGMQATSRMALSRRYA